MALGRCLFFQVVIVKEEVLTDFSFFFLFSLQGIQ